MDFFLDFELCKAVAEEHNGNYVFQVEASNENVDFQDQIVLQEALLKSKDNFLKNGVISYDHLHRKKDENGNMVSDPAMIIGEPIEVWTEGTRTFVKGILYKTNEKAMEVVKLLKAGSTRIRASVGGLFPKVTKGENGVEQIVSVLWNDLALTPCPVNNTVTAATFAKSLTPETFAKALSARACTDSAGATGGAVLVKEDMQKKVKPEIREQEDDEEVDEDAVIKSLLNKLEQGTLSTSGAVYEYLLKKGITIEDAWAVAHEIDRVGGDFVAKNRNTFKDKVMGMFKSMDTADEDMLDKADEPKPVDMEIDIEEEDDEENDEDGYTDDEPMEKGKSCKKSMAVTEGIDATDILTSLVEELDSNQREIKELRKSVADLGDCLVEISKAVATNASMVKSLGDEPVARKAAMSKSYKADASGTLTKADFVWAQKALCKAVADGEIDLVKSTMIERDMQLAMANPSHQMKDEYFKFLQNKFATGGN